MVASSTRGMRKLARRHVQSVVGLSVRRTNTFCVHTFNQLPSILCWGTGSIIHCSHEFILILTCAHTFKPLAVCHAPGYDTAEILDVNTIIQIDFIDGHAARGRVYCIDWWKDVCMVLIPSPVRTVYRSIQFVDTEVNLRGDSVYRRGARVSSIFCFPASNREGKLLFGTATKGYICGRSDIVGSDLDVVYDPALRFFGYDLSAAGGCSWGPVFSDKGRVLGMNIAQVDKIKLGLKLIEIQEWMFTWFHIRASNVNEAVAKICRSMTRQLNENRRKSGVTGRGAASDADDKAYWCGPWADVKNWKVL